ncbi:MAG: glycoside hydrolase family 16 protein [Saprospiraceae bacterium]|nr:glycoside hydrolase family 16 protein [Saprospiraceae bacterium]
MHIDVWSIDATLVNIYPISPPNEKGFALNLEKGVWNSFDIPLSAFSDVVNLAEVLQFKFDGGTGVETIFIDNLYFYGECYIAPDCPQLVWADEFDGTSLNLSNWTPLTGDGCDINLCGWGNNELQWYQPQNAVVSNGSLKITAKQESVGGRAYTSARLITKDKQDFTYGRFEASIKLPEGQGIWPAFWMFHTDAVYGPWPMSGEIDIMEYLGQEKDRIFGTIHHGDLVPNNRNTSGGFRLVNGDFTERFYEFAIEWEENVIRWYIDDYLYLTLRPEDIAPDFWPFNQDFHFLLNVAVGGNLPGNPDATTTFPQTMEVDYVRVYKGRFAHLTGTQRVDYQAEGEVYTVENAGPGSSYNWTVEGGTIVAGQGTSQITVNWGEANQNAKVSVTTTSECGAENTISLDVAIDVQRVIVREFALENFDDEALITFLNASGTFTDNAANPAPNDLNNSALVGKYVRNDGAQFDNIQYSTAAIPDASVFTSGSKTFYVDFYTDAPVGTPLLLQLENSNESLPTNFPAGRHSRYQAITTVQNAWQRLAFTFLDRPDGGTSNTGVDRIVFLFNPNTFTNNTYYYDNFDRYCTDEEEKCFDDSDFVLSDPCNCRNPKNIVLADGTYLFEDTLKIDASSFANPTITFVSQDGKMLNAAGAPLTATTANFIPLGGGVFGLQFYKRSNTTATITVDVNGQQRSFTTTSCTPCPAVVAVPTMGQWGLFLFGLLMINLSLIFLYQKRMLYSHQ